MKYSIIFILIIFIIIAEDKKDEKKKKFPINVIDVYFKNFSFKVNQIIQCGENLKNIYLWGTEGNIFYSKNYGKDWEDLKFVFNLPHQKKNFNFEEIYQNPNDNKHLIFIEDNGSHFETLNCNENIKPILNGNRLQDFLFHPYNKNYILANYYELCNNKNENCTKEWILKLSKDQGKTWIDLKKDVVEFCWGKYVDNLLNSSAYRIFYIIHSFKSKILNYTDDFFKNSINIFDDVYSMELTKNFIFVDTDKKFSKYVSDALGDLYTFYPIKFDKINNNNYKTNIVNTGFKDMTYLTAVWKVNELEISGLYFSDHWGINYQSLLDYLVCEYKSVKCDVHIVNSLEGVIIANVYDEKIITTLMNISPKDDSLFYLENFENLSSKIYTVISYDYGKTWNLINAPLYNIKNKLFNCDKCYLNLFISGIKKTIPQNGIISQKSSPGIIIAQGSVGKYLADYKNPLGVYLSEDGGLNWKEILSGEYTYTMIDQGGFILAGIQNLKTNGIKFSTDYGNNWTDLKISENFIYIKEIFIDSLEKENKFLILGYESNKNPKSYIITVDLKDLHQKNCEYSDNLEFSDYEIFIPFNISGENNCYNGRKVNFLRKKKDRNCYNKSQKNLYKIKEICKCTEEDWSCNYGFKRDENEKCVMITSQNLDPNIFINNYEGFKKFEKEDYCINGLYKKNPYIKNARSYCEDGINYGDKFILCEKDFNFLPIILFLVLILIIIFLIIILKKFFNKKNKFKKNHYENDITNLEDNDFNNDKLFMNENEI